MSNLKPVSSIKQIVQPEWGLNAKRPGFPPFSEFDFGMLDLFRIETGVGFNLLHDFYGLMDVAAMQGVDLGQFDS